MKTYTPADFGPFTLSESSHSSPAEGMCVMEMVSFLAGEEWSDTPQCSSPVVSLFCQVINDRMGQEFRDKLQAYVPRLIGTASPAHDQERAEYLAWQAITVFAPAALRNTGFAERAAALENFDRSRGLGAASAAACVAASAAARAAACAAARDPARAAEAAACAAEAAACAATRAADSNLIFRCLDGLLEIGPSGSAYTEGQMNRAEPLRKAMEPSQ